MTRFAVVLSTVVSLEETAVFVEFYVAVDEDHAIEQALDGKDDHYVLCTAVVPE